MDGRLAAKLEVPALETERLKLRGHRLEDFQLCATMWADPVVTRYIGGRPFTEEECWTRLLRYIGHWALLGFGYWLVEDKSAGRFVGEVGFADYKRDINPSLEGKPEIGWVLASHAHGKGYATEAVRAATAWADENFAPSETTCIIDPQNRASVRVAEKCGYREAGIAMYKGRPVLLFVRQAGSRACRM